MPSLRVLSVVILVGMGAAVAAVGGAGDSGEPGNQGPSSLLTARSGADGSAVGVGAAGSVNGALSSSSGTSATSGASFDVRAENRKAGTPGWRITRARGSKPGLAGYAGAVSVLPGQPLPLSVSGDGPVRIRALRIGWYGGTGARQVWQGTLRAQPETSDPPQWPTRGLADTTGWPEGHYLLRLDQGSASRYLPLTVRSANNRGRIVVLTSPMTWVAENTTRPLALTGEPATTGTGTGKSTGAGATSTGTATSAKTAALPKVSFNRPYAAGYGSAGFLQNDAAVVELAERTGHRIGFVTDYDIAANPSLLAGAAAVLTGGDSQYWTASLRTAIRSAGDAGTNLAFFGAGTGARQIRLVDADRAMQISRAKPSKSVQLTGLRPSCSVSSPAADAGPSSGATNTGTGTSDTADTDTASRTGSAGSAGSASAEAGSGSAGAGSGSAGEDDAAWVISNADWWGYRGAGVKTDDVLPGLVAGRVDRAATDTASSPAPMQVLSFTRVACGSANGTVAQSGTYLVRPSGAGVFAAGTSRWACALANACSTRSGKAVKLDDNTQQVVARVTRNVINAFAQEKAGERFTAKNTASQYTALR